MISSSDAFQEGKSLVNSLKRPRFTRQQVLSVYSGGWTASSSRPGSHRVGDKGRSEARTAHEFSRVDFLLEWRDLSAISRGLLLVLLLIKRFLLGWVGKRWSLDVSALIEPARVE